MTERNAALRSLHHWPTRTLCLFLIILQAISINWYLMDNLSYIWAAIYAADAVVITLFVTAMMTATSNIHQEKHVPPTHYSELRHTVLTYVSWLVYAILLDFKVGVIFTKFSTELDEDNFFGPNTLKTTLALSGIIFIVFLSTQHDLRHGYRRELLISLTGTVIFDILDGVDNLDNLFEADVRDTYPTGLDDTIIVICCINFALPAVPLATLAITRFGMREFPKRLELFHKLTLAYIINLPLFVTRMITWHGLSQGISIFMLKNIIVMSVTAFEVLEHYFTQDKAQEGAEEVHAHEYKHEENGRNNGTRMHAISNNGMSNTSI